MKKLFKVLFVCLTLSISTLSLAARPKILLIVTPNCQYCTQAENILNKNGISYRTSMGRGAVPRLYVDGEYKGTGVDAVQTWINTVK